MLPIDVPRSEALLDRMERLLEACTSVQTDLARVLAVKRDAMVRMDARALIAANADLEQSTIRWQELESARQETHRALASALQLPPSHVGLPELIEIVGEARRFRLTGLRARLKTAALEVARLNSLNRTLTEVSLDYTRDMIKLLAHWGQNQKTYTREGKQTEKAPDARGLIDHVA